MSSFDAAHAASTRTPSVVISREIIVDGFIVSVRIPKTVSYGSYLSEGTRITFFHFARTVPGGAIHFFLHSQDRTLIGKTISAQATVMRKHYPDGSAVLYVDLVPSDGVPTVGIAVMKREHGSWSGTEWPVIETAEPLDGVIIIHPLNAKLVPTSLMGDDDPDLDQVKVYGDSAPPNTVLADKLAALGLQAA